MHRVTDVKMYQGHINTYLKEIGIPQVGQPGSPVTFLPDFDLTGNGYFKLDANSKSVRPMRRAVEDYLQSQRPDVLFLEWNLGMASLPDATFDPAFFGGHPSVTFVMTTSTAINANLANLPANVDVRMIGMPLGNRPGVIHDVVKASVARGTQPGIQPGVTAHPGPSEPHKISIGDDGLIEKLEESVHSPQVDTSPLAGRVVGGGTSPRAAEQPGEEGEGPRETMGEVRLPPGGKP